MSNIKVFVTHDGRTWLFAWIHTLLTWTQKKKKKVPVVDRGPMKWIHLLRWNLWSLTLGPLSHPFHHLIFCLSLFCSPLALSFCMTSPFKCAFPHNPLRPEVGLWLSEQWQNGHMRNTLTKTVTTLSSSWVRRRPQRRRQRQRRKRRNEGKK